MRRSAALALLAIVACKSESKTLGTLPPGSRVAPLSPGARAQLEAAGAQCTPNPTGPVLCTWNGGGASCRLVFDGADALTELSCEVDGLTWRCTRPGDLYLCRWDDDPSCGTIYSTAGIFEAYLCGQALQDRLGGADGGTSGDDASISRADSSDLPDGSITPDDSSTGHGDSSVGPDDRGVIRDDSGTRRDGGTADAGPSCRGRDEAACTGDPRCRPFYCPLCVGHRFATCGEPNDGPPPCAAPVCSCAGLDLTACDANPDCHSVFVDRQMCACAPAGCCATFDHCAEGPTADCVGADLSCRIVEPHCEGDYIVAYANMCYEGCVRRTACDPTIGVQCAGSATPSFPRFQSNCNAPSDCAAAIHQTDCCGTRHALGINTRERGRFDAAEAFCEGQYPQCDCVDRGIEADDGAFTQDPNRVQVDCVQNSCRTFIR